MHQHCCQRDRPHPHTHQLINHVVDCIAACRPYTLFAEYPKAATTYDEGFVKVTYGRLAKSVDCFAHWLVKEFGHGQDFETLAYIGPSDLRYPTLVLGSIKAGYKVLMLSPRNSVAAQLHLMKATNCTRLLTPAQRPPPVKSILADDQASHITAHEVPSVEELLQAECPQFTYNKTLAEAASDPLVIMHTSGSTGLPKPVIWRQSFIPAYAKQWQLEPPAGISSMDHWYQGNRLWVVFPAFHAAYVAHVFINGMCNQTSLIFPLSGAIPSAMQLSEALKHTSVDSALLVPSMIEEMSDSPEVLDHIAANLDRLVFSGGDVPRGCGDRVSSKVQLTTFYGTSEFASLPYLQPSYRTNEDWKYLSFHPCSGVEFRQHAEDMHEMVIVRKPELEQHQPVFTTFPDDTEYHTKDLFLPHPTKPGLWTHCGRTDDIVVFSTGEKTNPVAFEQAVFARHPEIIGVLLIGNQRFQASLLIEVAGKTQLTSADRAGLLSLFWPSVDLANQSVPAHAQVTRSHVWFVSPSKPMARSPKGTIQRRATITEYARELDAWYEQAENLTASHDGATKLDAHDSAALSAYVKDIAQTITGRPHADTDNFFIGGMDSLQALILAQDLKAKLQDPSFGISTVYAAPSIRQLVATIRSGAAASPAIPTNGKAIVASRESIIDSTLTKLSGAIDLIKPESPVHSRKGESIQVLLTGSTGSLAAQILEDLLMRSDVSHVYCLNRARDGGLAQQLSRRKASHYSGEYHTDRVTFIHGDPSKHGLGLSNAMLDQLSLGVDLIVHNAWSVNFNTPLSAFIPQLEAVVELIQFASMATKKPSIAFMSSVSALSNLASSPVPEQVVKDASAPSTMGYGESKYIAERLLEHASDKLNLDVRLVRLGQIAGPIGSSQAEWNPHEWFPSIVRSSSYVQALPQELPGMLAVIDWIPIDSLSEIVIELSTNSPRASQLSDGNVLGSKCAVYNIVNQHPVTWSTLAPSIASSFATKPQLVTFLAWLEIVRGKLASDSAAEGSGLAEALDRNPAGKLLDFFESTAVQERSLSWDSRKAAEASTGLRKLEGIKGEWVQRWMARWLVQS